MSPEQILEAYAAGRMTMEEAKRRLLGQLVVDAGCAQLDLHREARAGGPEVVYCAGKTPEQVAVIFGRLAAHGGRALGTRAEPAHAAALPASLDAVYDPVSRLLRVGPDPEPRGRILILSAGTSDMPVAEEAAGTARFLGSGVACRHDCGVAGIHRLFTAMEDVAGATALVVVAGMEGALPSVVGGLTDLPVVAVPTSVGYGASFQGLAALLAMMNSCAPGVGVVNIDNGFGAGFLAHKINMRAVRGPVA
ncbi:nickel pincer cofactor biosynthesis protein LarB [Pseudodesulfovibrio sp.]|uniref:nickel pincer cofactor biosynthesis protein LarB n=1 Tax=Pseudodesulfovibrio sp. TaxID=2035812 RepID=UPI00260F62F7|nr:nickel pincer cofactor biosynthesis protein LarB [Pseudodesulfovibrio sp.]MDD3310522.1 nickel pincer cofactor biosynthesis protein LarB [Pseudodesulfovibrio sp.]